MSSEATAFVSKLRTTELMTAGCDCGASADERDSLGIVIAMCLLSCHRSLWPGINS